MSKEFVVPALSLLNEKQALLGAKKTVKQRRETIISRCSYLPQTRQNPASITSSEYLKEPWGKVCKSGICKHGRYNFLKIIKVLKCPLERPRIATSMMEPELHLQSLHFLSMVLYFKFPCASQNWKMVDKSVPYLLKQANLVKGKMKKPIPKTRQHYHRGLGRGNVHFHMYVPLCMKQKSCI